MQFLIILFLVAGFSFSEEKRVCINVKGDFPKEKYIRIIVRKRVERALLESGYKPSCQKPFVPLNVVIKRVEERPIAYTSKGRISSYNLSIELEMVLGDKRETFTGFAPYRQPTGAVGDLYRKKAVNEIIDKIYLNILKFISRR